MSKAKANVASRIHEPLSEFQDGAPSKRDGEVLLKSLSMIARGNYKKDIHAEKAMDDFRHSVGLYVSYPLANDILAGSLKRFVQIWH